MRRLTQNEIARTAFKQIPNGRWGSAFGYKYPGRDKNTMCPYCKNEDTDVVHNRTDLNPFMEFYRDRVESFTVVNCFSCSAVWSFFIAKKEGLQHEPD